MWTRLHHMLAHAARFHGDAAALSCRDTSLTYAQLWSEVREVADGLSRLGVGRYERVAIYLDKRIETVVAIFAASVAGAVFVPVNPLLRGRQVRHILTDCDVTVLVTSPERLSSLREDLKECKSLQHIVLVGDDVEAGDGSEGVTRWSDLPGGSDADARAGGIDLDMAAILYTSGSTGTPKGVVLSHRNLIVGAQSVSHYLGNDADDVILAVLPLSFDAGLSQLTTGFAAGAHVVLVNYLAPAEVVRLCARHGVTGLTCVPPLWVQLAEQDWPEEVGGRLRYFANTGGRMPKTTLDRLRAVFPSAEPYLMYGLTEAFRSTYLDPVEVDKRPDSIGKAIPNAEVLVVRPDGSECEPGEPGELVHRGALVALGYWNDPERTAERFRPVPRRHDGPCRSELAVWSGDTVVRDDDGFLYFVGRNDEMIKTSGYRVSPTEVEEAAYDTGMVRAAVAVGVADPRLGQRIAIAVTPTDGADVDPRSFTRMMTRQLPGYMVPSEVAVCDELPRMSNGKFDRAAVRRQLIGEDGP